MKGQIENGGDEVRKVTAIVQLQELEWAAHRIPSCLITTAAIYSARPLFCFVRLKPDW